jgi:hypothetical protein
MTLNPQLWYVRWFFWCCRMLDRFWHTDHDQCKQATNLCQFFRILFFGTLINALVIAGYCYVLFVVFVLPFLLFAPLSIGLALAATFGAISAFVAFVVLIWGCVVGISKTTDYLSKKKLDHTDDKPGFWKVLIHYLVSIKQRFCPLISFSGGNTDV